MSFHELADKVFAYFKANGITAFLGEICFGALRMY